MCCRTGVVGCIFFFNDTATTEIYTLSLHDALPISVEGHQRRHHVDLHVGKRSEGRSEEHTSELQSLRHLVCRLLLEKKTIYEWLSSSLDSSTTRTRPLIPSATS